MVYLIHGGTILGIVREEKYQNRNRRQRDKEGLMENERLEQIREMREKLMAMGASEDDVRKLFAIGLATADKIINEAG